jgi:general secretion pathway protein B
MSYILEALKKAQSERQLTSAPTIHSVPIQAEVLQAANPARTPAWIVLAALALVAAGAGAMWWLRAPPVAPAPAVLAQQPVAPQPATPQPATPQPAIVLPPPPVLAVKAAPVVAAAPAPAPAPLSKPAPLPREAPPAAVKPAPLVEPVPVVAAIEDALPFAHNLPEPLRSDVPKVTFGGYMYSKNPADRLLLIDKVLRHEGEEVAPGLVLEKLMPKAAVMNFRGTRYRVAY